MRSEYRRGIALADQFRVQHIAVGEIGVGECASVAVFMPALSDGCAMTILTKFFFTALQVNCLVSLAESQIVI
jgi:hypothetical protein